ncbi:MAG: EAL domain-containing protein [Ruminiclostridium sp.]|nr:EAL domain-containing protein [Ruminiclostridium sp.]
MPPMLYFDVCSVPIFMIILVAVFARRMTKGLSNRLYITLLVLSVLSALSDIIVESVTSSLPVSDAGVVVSLIAGYVYFIARNASIVTYFFFVFAITGTWYRIRPKRMKAILLIPFSVIILTVASNPFTGLVFTFTSEDGYSRGYGIIIIYAICTFYALGGTIYLMSCYRFIPKNKMFPLVSLYVLSMAAVVLQYFYRFLLVEMIATAFSMVLVILFVLRPEEISDVSVGSLSFEAYKSELKKILLTKQNVHVAIISFTNAYELRSYLGEMRFQTYVAHVIRQVDIMFRREHVFFDIYYEHPGTMYIIIDDPKYDVEDAYSRLAGELMRRSEKAVSAGERLTAVACDLMIPGDLSDFDEIIRFGRDYIQQVPAGRVFVKASDIIASKDYRIISNMDIILNRAIAERRFKMYYQPIYSVERGRFISAEALIRLFDDEFGFVSPGLFIPAAEKRGVILPIGDFVLEEVHRFISDNDIASLGLEYIEINLSIAQCMQEELPERLAFLSDKYGVTPEKINLEITESTYEDIGSVMQFNLESLSGVGYTFSLDDYGTGYSNMQRVSKLPLKIIKLDKSLVDDMASDDGMSIVRNTIKMMRDINKELVAEGVETKENLEYLEQIGCHFIQGYYFSKPLPEKEFVTFIKQHNRIDA